MNEELSNFLKDLITLLQEKYDQSHTEKQAGGTEADFAFQQGAGFAYYDALDLIRSQLIAFGYDVESLEPIVPHLGKKMSEVERKTYA